MNICIIDDNLLHINEIKKVIMKNFNDCNLKMIDNSKYIDNEYDLFFIDIDLKNENGIDIAFQITTDYPLSKIIFVSEHNDLIFNTLAIQPFYFIRKDHLENDFRIFLSLLKKENIKIIKEFVLINGLKVKINTQKILYIEVMMHRTYIYTNPKQPYIIYKSLKEILYELNVDYIIQTHKSYAINIYHMLKVEDNECYLKGNIKIPVGRKYKEKLINKYLEVL